ncbi:MAG: hypothetical protein R8K53_05040 [Mariprofundaceae bacterium]
MIKQASSETAMFQDMVLDAEHDAHIQLPHALEGHLVFLLLRFLRGSKRLSGAVALHYLQAANQHGHAQISALSDTGDACLLLAGMFPGQAKRRMVNAGYFADVGLACYHTLAGKLLPSNAELYHQLCDGFGEMLGVLRTLHHYTQRGYHLHQSGSDMLDAYALWQHTACPTAFAELCEINGGIPVKSEQRHLL